MNVFGRPIVLVGLVITLGLSCGEDDDPEPDFFSEYDSRTFEMGFTTWPYAPTLEAVDATYQFVQQNGDVYSEHIDANIPWSSWMNNDPLPQEFTNDILGRAQRKLSDVKLTLSVSLLNLSRDDLAFDYDGSVPSYVSFADEEIEDAYFKHLEYITDLMDPEYLIMALEVNELLVNRPELWEGYKQLMDNLRPRISARFPTVQISESITLHNLFRPDVQDPDALIEDIITYANSLDFVAISFYPYFKGLSTKEDFQEAFDFLHREITKPIAFAETGHLSEDLSVESTNLFIPGNAEEQNDYLESLLTNAQEEDYEYVIWWTHRDYNELWETFPAEVRDLGKVWLSTGIINEDGVEKEAYSTWALVEAK